MTNPSDPQLSSAKWSPVAVRLLQGVVYSDDHSELWDTLLANVSALSEYFAKIGLSLIVDESDGMAYLRQIDEEDAEADTPVVPKLFRRTPLGYDATLLCVLLRDELRQYEEEDVQNARCIILQSDLLALWEAFYPDENDDVKLNRQLSSTLRKLEELRFVRLFEKDPPSWEIRRILKARVPLADLERLRLSLVAAVGNHPTPNHEETL